MPKKMGSFDFDQESIIQNYSFLRFLVFDVKFSYFVKVTIKRPSLIAKNEKNVCFTKKKFGRIDAWVSDNLIKICQ